MKPTFSAILTVDVLPHSNVRLIGIRTERVRKWWKPWTWRRRDWRVTHTFGLPAGAPDEDGHFVTAEKLDAQ